MKLLYCSDLHGAAEQYARLEAVAKARRPDIVVLGGDMLPDDSALEPARLGRGQPRWVQEEFRQIVTRLKEQVSIPRILLIFGNHDWGSSAVAMKQLALDGLVSILDHVSPLNVNGLGFLGYSCTPPTPWYVKDFERLDLPGDPPPLLGGARWDARFSKPMSHSAGVLFKQTRSIAEELAELTAPPQPWVFVVHAPPFGTDLDRSYEGEPWGSRAVRAAIEKHHPVLSLHGHVHESPLVSGSCTHRLGATLAVNAGQAHDKLWYAWIEMDVSAVKVRNLQHEHQL